MRLPVFFQAPKAVEKFQQRVKKKLGIYHGRCPSGFRPLPNPLRFGFPGLDPRSKSARGPNLLADLLKIGFEELLSLQPRLMNIQGLVHAAVHAVINVDRNIPLVVRFLQT